MGFTPDAETNLVGEETTVAQRAIDIVLELHDTSGEIHKKLRDALDAYLSKQSLCRYIGDILNAADDKPVYRQTPDPLDPLHVQG